MTALRFARRSAPNCSGLYLLKVSSDVLYVGKAGNLLSRLSGFHHVLDAIPKSMEKALTIETVRTPNVDEFTLANLEAIFIDRLNPCLNQVKPTILRIDTQHLKLLEPYMTAKAKTVKTEIVKVDHPKPSASVKSLTDTFKALSRSISAYTRSDWDLTDEAKNSTMVICHAFGIKPSEALEIAADLTVAMIASRIDPENSENNLRLSQDRLAEKFQASELHSNPRCLKLLEVWMTESDRPSVESVCLSVLQKIPANCSTIDLAHITHRINSVYGES